MSTVKCSKFAASGLEFLVSRDEVLGPGGGGVCAHPRRCCHYFRVMFCFLKNYAVGGGVLI